MNEFANAVCCAIIGHPKRVLLVTLSAFQPD